MNSRCRRWVPSTAAALQDPSLVRSIEREAVDMFLAVVAPDSATGKQEEVLRLGMGRLLQTLVEVGLAVMARDRHTRRDALPSFLQSGCICALQGGLTLSIRLDACTVQVARKCGTHVVLEAAHRAICACHFAAHGSRGQRRRCVADDVVLWPRFHDHADSGGLRQGGRRVAAVRFQPCS